MTAFPDWRDTGSGGVTTNVLSLIGQNLKSIVDGVQSNTVMLGTGSVIVNSLVNNGDNTLTSDVNGQTSTTDIILTAAPTKPDDNHIAMAVNGVGNTQVPIVSTISNSIALNQLQIEVNGEASTAVDVVTNVQLSLVGSDLTSSVNGVPSAPVDLSPILPPATTNTLVNNGNNTFTSTVDGVSSTDDIIINVGLARTFPNTISSQVNGEDSGDVAIIATNALSLTGNALKSTINSIDSNTVNVQIPIPSPTNNNLASMDASGYVKDAGVSVTTSSSSNDNTHLMTSAAMQSALTAGLATKEPTITNLPVTKGGTGLVLYAIGDIVYASGTTTLSRLAAVALGSVYASGGVGAAPILTNAPAFGGNPTAPNLAQGNNSTKLANTSYVDTGLAAKADAAATTAALALKAPIASPTFTGTVTAPIIITSSMLVSGKGGSLATVDDTGSITPSFAINILKGYKLSYASATTLGLTAGSANAFDFNHPSGGSIIYTQTANVVINIANVGVVNGLDIGSATNSTNYYVYAIFHGTTTSLNGGMISAVSPVFGPNLPSGYVASRYVGRVRRDGSGNFIPFIQTGTGVNRTTTFNGAASATQVLSGGTSASFTTLGLSTFLPPGVRAGIMRVDYAPASAFSSMNFRETGSLVGTTTGLISYGPGSIAQFRDLLPFLCNGSQSIDYLLSGAGDTANLYLYSYDEELGL